MSRATPHRLRDVAATAFIVVAATGGCGNPTDPGTGNPGIAILAPADGAAVSIATSTYVPVQLAVTDFALRAPGLCAGVDDACGHVHVFVDGDSCNGPEPSNNAFPTAGSAVSPATAIALLARCTTIEGPHTISLQLARDDHSPVTNGAAAMLSVVASTGAPSDGGTPPDATTD